MGEKRAAFKSTPGFRVSRVRRRCELMHRHPRAIDSALAPSVIYLTSNFRGVQDRRKIIWREKTLTICCSILRGNASYGWWQAVFRTQKVTVLKSYWKIEQFSRYFERQFFFVRSATERWSDFVESFCSYVRIWQHAQMANRVEIVFEICG